MNNFINEFKIYCENVENTKVLEIIKGNIINSFYNLEFFIQDYMENFADEIEEGLRLSKLLEKLALKAKSIKDLDIKEVWKAFEIAEIDNKIKAREIIIDTLVETYEDILKKYNIDRENVTDEIIEQEKWYKDLYLLETKHFE